MPDEPRYLDAGETALVVEFGITTDPDLSERVLDLDHALAARSVAGISETVPTYRSLMIHYDPFLISRDKLIDVVSAAVAAGEKRPAGETSSWIFPCCYDPAFAEDLAEVSKTLGISEERIVELHSGAAYRIAMYGFSVGFGYLHGLPRELAISRRSTPRSPHPPNAIIIGGGLCAIAPLPMPTGWWVIARTPEAMFSPGRTPAFLAAVGDEVKFEAVDCNTFEALQKRAMAGEVVARKELSRI